MLALRVKSASQEVIFLQTTTYWRVTASKASASQVLHAVIGFFQPLCSEFVEEINVGAAKGWVRFLKEEALSDDLSSAVDDGWLNLSIKITLVSREHLRNALPRVLRELPTHCLPKIDNRTEVRHQGTNRFVSENYNHSGSPLIEGVGRIDEIDRCYRLTTNKWFARYEVRDPRPPSETKMAVCVRTVVCASILPGSRERTDLHKRVRGRRPTLVYRKHSFVLLMT